MLQRNNNVFEDPLNPQYLSIYLPRYKIECLSRLNKLFISFKETLQGAQAALSDVINHFVFIKRPLTLFSCSTFL